MKYITNPNRKTAIAATAVFLISALIFAFFSVIATGLVSNVFEMTSLIFFMTAILIISRYLTFLYVYTAEDFEFTITKNTAKTKSTVCRLYYTELVDILPTKNTKKKDRSLRSYNYCTTLFPQNSYCIFYETASESGIIKIECSDAFAEHLKKLIHVTDVEDIQ